MNAKPRRDQLASRLAPGPFPRPLNVHEVPRDGLDRIVAASAEERVAIAGDIDIPVVSSLSVAFKIKPRAGGRFHVRGDLQARITQTCVVTLEPFESDVEQAIDIMFAPAIADMDYRLPKRRDREWAEAPRRPLAAVPGNDDQDDPADPIIDDTIDLGAVALEFLVLACDIHPRKPGVHFTDAVIGDNSVSSQEPLEEPSAFAALQRLKDPS